MAAERRRAWAGSLAVFALGTALLLWAFRAEIGTAVALWANSSTYGYAFFILPITVFLIYWQRETLGRMIPTAAPWGLIPVLGATALWMLGELGNIMVVKQLAFVALWQSLFLVVMGWRITRAVLFPLAYLFLAVPLGSEIIPLLQDVTAQIVVHLLRLTGMPVFLDGYYIQIPSGSFLVAEACSGLRFLIVCIALGFLVAYLFFSSLPKRILFVGLSLAVPIIANGFRAYGIIMLAHLSDYRLAADVDHIVYGFIFLSVIILTLVGLAALLRDRAGPVPVSPAASAQPTEGAPRRMSRLAGQALCAGLAISAVFLGQTWTAVATTPPQSALSAELQSPNLSPEWVAIDTASPAWTARFAHSDAVLARTYSDGASRVDLQVAYYAYQREGAEALSELNTQLVGPGWSLSGQQILTLQVAGRQVPVVELIVRKEGGSRLVWYWYEIDGQPTNSRIIGKLLEMKATILGQGRAASIIVVSTEIADGRQAAAAALEGFLKIRLDMGADLVQVKE